MGGEQRRQRLTKKKKKKIIPVIPSFIDGKDCVVLPYTTT
jgi:hypothetical protein